MYKRKYKKGNSIVDLNEIPKQEFVYHNEKIYSIGWIMGWQFRTIVTAIKRGSLFYAIKND